jgi:hypothetical protein
LSSEFKVNKVLGQGDAIASVLFNVQGKEIPLQAWTGPEGSRRQRFPDFKIIGT